MARKASEEFNMRVLFVTRTYPPSVGGLETASFEVGEALKRRVSDDVTLITYGGGKKWLPLAYPWLAVRALWEGLRTRHDVIYVPDGVMAPMGRLLRMVLHTPVVLTLNGKELTYQNPIYRKVVSPSIGHMNYLTAISSPTAAMAAAAYPKSLLQKVVLGSTDRFYDVRGQQAARDDLAQHIGLELADKKILYTSGRLIRRKGVLWFVGEVLPEVIKQHPDVMYVVVGKGEDYEEIEAMVKKLHLENHVYLLGYVDDAVRNLLYNAADLFIMPNVPVKNDMEGLGLVAIEASSCGTPVIGSNLEGVQDAVVVGKTGYLLPPKDKNSYVKRIMAELTAPTLDRTNVRKVSLKTYDWDKTADEYIEVFRRAISSYKN